MVGSEAQEGQIRIFMIKDQEFGFILSVMRAWGKGKVASGGE